jgi:hypothetical protein
LWAWVEATSGQFEFGDYDRLLQLAEKNGAQEPFFYIKSGTSGGRSLIFVFFPTGRGSREFAFRKRLFYGAFGCGAHFRKNWAVRENEEGGEINLRCPAWRFAVLLFG